LSKPSRSARPLRLLAISLGLLALCGGALRLVAMPPPTPEMLEQYRKDGTLKARIAAAKAMGNHRVEPELLEAAKYRLKRMVAPKGESDLLMTPPPAWSGGLPSTGTPKVLVVCIDFPDYPHSETKNSAAILQNRIFGSGDAGGGAAPYESLTNFYKRASYNQLTIGGNVLGWYRSAQNRSAIPTTTAGRQALIQAALNYYDGQGHDFSQYDNNGDGRIDYFAVIWTGPDTGWSEFWWAYQTSWSQTTTPLTIDGKTLGRYSWQWESNPVGGNYQAHTLIHETGHALGLPDYYDYDDTVGPQGGLGGLDMMDSNWGDHNCFSKFLLNWITPSVYTTSATGVSLRAAGSYGDAAIVMPDATAGNAFGEFFMVQNRDKVANDTGYPGKGLLIWHVDSRLDSASHSDYVYDNSYAAHKLLRLMEADGLEQIEAGTGGTANAGDYYGAGSVFGPTSFPNSARYDGSQIWMGIDTVSAPGATMTFNVFTTPVDTTAPTGAPSAPTGSVTDPDTPVFTWGIGTAADPESGITSYKLQVGTTPGGNDVFDGVVGKVLTKSLLHLGEDGKTYYARVLALNGAAMVTGWSPNSAGLTISYPTLTCSTLDNCGLTFKTVGPWFGESTVSYFGGSAAQSAAIDNNSSTSLQTTVAGPGALSFRWKVSCEAPESATVFYDNLAVSIDGVVKKQIGGEVDWTKETYAIPSGSHVIRWTYTKDPSAVGGSDAGWVDKVEYVGSNVVVPAITALGINHGVPGCDLVLTGTGFTGTTSVQFGSYSTDVFEVDSDTQITVPVPEGALTGVIGVVNAAGSASSASTFTVLGYDLNKDAYVDLADLARLSRYFGVVGTDAGFPAELDLNGDLVIDEKDVLLFFNGL